MPADPAPGSLAQKDASTLGNMICRDFLRGVCYRGQNCKFLHSEQHAPPVTNQLPVCRDYQSGTCNRRTCKYAHIYSASGFYDPVTMKPIPQSDSKLLKEQTIMQANYFADNGASFPASNGYEEVFKTRANPNDPLCKDFQNGYCQRGETCRYRHVSFITDDNDYPLDMMNAPYQAYNTYDQNYPPQNQPNDFQNNNYYSNRNQGYEKYNYPQRTQGYDSSTKRGPMTDSKYEYAEKNVMISSNAPTNIEIENLKRENKMLRDEIESLKAELALLKDKTPLPLKINDPYLMPSETHFSKHSQSKDKE